MKLSRKDLLAMTVHSSLKTYCSMLGYPYAIPRWENLSDADMQFGIEIVQEVLELMKITEIAPCDVHSLWVKKRLAMGYKRGFKRDRATKVHPNMIPFELLPAKEQMKSKIVLGTIRLFGTIESEQIMGDVEYG
jgi:hypothetical protein